MVCLMSRKPNLLQQFVLDLQSGKLHREFHNGPDPDTSIGQVCNNTDSFSDGGKCRVWLKNDPTSKMWLLGNSWIFSRQIVYSCLIEYCPLVCSFCIKLLYVYKIGIMANFLSSNFAITLRDVTFQTNTGFKAWVRSPWECLNLIKKIQST